MSALSLAYNLLINGKLKDEAGEFAPARVDKILVVRNDNIGDVICTTPALDALREAFPKAFIAALVCTLAEEAVSGHRALDAVYAYPKAKHKQYGALESYLRMARVLREIRKQRFDLAVCFRADFSSSQAWLPFAGKVRWRLGPEARGKKAPYGFFYNLPAAWPPKGIHEVRRCFHLLSQMRVDSEPKRLYLKLPEHGEAAAFLASHLPTGKPAPVVVNLTKWSYRPDREWPSENYLGLIKALKKQGRQVIVTHAPADREWVSGLLAGLKSPPPVFWSKSLKEFAAVAGASRAFVTAEGGPMHLAAAAGAPLAVIWGRTPVDVWHPWGVPYRIVGARGQVADITVDEVLKAVDELEAARNKTQDGDTDK